MKAPLVMFTELIQRVRDDLYKGKPDKLWFAQKKMVKKALLYPARWLDERKVPISTERYKAILESIVATMVASGNLTEVTYMSRYLLTCVQRHMEHHGDAYYQEGKAIRNRVNVFMTSVEKANRGGDLTVSILAEADKLVQIGKRKAGTKRSAPSVPVIAQPRKTRSDALIYKLSPEQRKEIAARLASGASYRKIVELCAFWGIKTSLGGLTEYLRSDREKVANSN